MDSLNTLSERLSTLDSVELQRVIDLAKTLQATRSCSVESNEIIIFYETLCEEVKLYTGIEGMPLHSFKRSNRKGYNKLCEMVTLMEAWAANVDADVKTRLKKRNFYATMAMLVSSFLDDLNVPISVKTLLNSFEKFPGLIDKAFPGYVRSGLIRTIFNRSRGKDKFAA